MVKLDLCSNYLGSQQSKIEITLNDPRTKKYLNGKNPKKIIFIKGKIINIVT